MNKGIADLLKFSSIILGRAWKEDGNKEPIQDFLGSRQ